MDHSSFDTLTRAIGSRRTRRTLAALLGAAAAAPVLGTLLEVPGLNDAADAKKNTDKKPRRYKQKRKLCLNGQQVKSKRKKRVRRWIRQGATRGKCPTPNGCGSCPAGSICVNGVCTPCTVTCSGDAATCGTALQSALTAGGTVYACPGTYGGNFTTNSVTVYGAGSGADAASNTILDGQGTGRTLQVADNATVSLISLRVTGGDAGSDTGGGINAGAGTIVSLTSCAVVSNAANNKNGGGGIYSALGTLTLTDTQVSQNTAGNGGGLRVSSGVGATLINCTISENVVQTSGGGLEVDDTTVSITGTAIDGNQAGQNGGGLFTNGDGTDVTFDSASSVTNNTATTSGSIYNNSVLGTVTLNGATVSGNTPNACTNVPGC
ncbi:MAG: hypothetical protein QM692_01835 [Thermomicrobiales bacterium]